MPILVSANWLDWYHFRHQQECFKSGTAFEDYVAKVLGFFHDDYVNPAPAGTLGDGGCDGLAESGTVLYACYGQRPGRNAERELAAKLESDFARALGQWGSFDTWRFVTNAPFGPESLRVLTRLQTEHGDTSVRPLTIRLLTAETLWTEVVSHLDPSVLNILFPGAPGIENVELADLIPLLDELGYEASLSVADDDVLPVPPTKMDFNALPQASRLEFNSGRLAAPRIDRWYEEVADPNLYDSHGQKFRAIYQTARGVTSDPAEILERLYVSVAGANFRMDGRRANAAFAVLSYFFDSCHIFEAPPAEVSTLMEGELGAPAN